MKVFALILAAAITTCNAIATPHQLVPRQAAFCSTVASRCTGTSRQAQVTSYCSSFLAIPRVTSTRTVSAAAQLVTVTVTQRVIGLTTSYITVQSTQTVNAAQTINLTQFSTARATATVSSTSTSTTTFTRSVVTGISTVQAADATKIISSCATVTNADAQITIMRVSGGRGKRDEPHQLFERQGVAKPACYTSYRSASQISSACNCASVRPTTVYTTRTVTPTNTIVRTVSSTTTSWRTATRTNTVLQTLITGTVTNTIVSTTTVTATSTIVRSALVSVTFTRGYISTTTKPATRTNFALAAAPTFYIQNDQTNYMYLSPADASSSKKIKRDSSGTLAFDSIPQSSAVLFTLPGLAGGTLTTPAGLLAAESIEASSSSSDFDDIDVQLVAAGDISSGGFAPVACTIVGQRADGTCPLQCQFGASSDVSQGDPFGNWMLGQPGAASSETWGLYAVGSWGGSSVGQVKKTGRREAA